MRRRILKNRDEAAVGCSDRAHSAASQLGKGDIDWDAIFARDGIRWFHTGGIFAGLSETTRDVGMAFISVSAGSSTSMLDTSLYSVR